MTTLSSLRRFSQWLLLLVLPAGARAQSRDESQQIVTTAMQYLLPRIRGPVRVERMPVMDAETTGRAHNLAVRGAAEANGLPAVRGDSAVRDCADTVGYADTPLRVCHFHEFTSLLSIFRPRVAGDSAVMNVSWRSNAAGGPLSGFEIGGVALILRKTGSEWRIVGERPVAMR
jgi:hypothetical protein